jgi:regulator of sigma E protease
MAEFFATFWNDVIVYWVWPLMLFLVGLGVVVCVHEFGHFIMAKRAGIRVNRFAIGFFQPIFSYRKGIGFRLGSTEQEYQARAAEKLVQDGVNVGAMLEKQRELKIYQAAEELGLGETEYRMNWLPIGGYVHMTGQDDFAPESTAETTDPRSYGAAPVGKRFGVIAAGVVMNMIFAAIMFPVIGLIGMEFPGPVIGDVAPTYPAAQAEITWHGKTPPAVPSDVSPAGKGLRPGDRVTHVKAEGFFASAMGGEATRFQDLMLPAILSDLDETLTVDFERTVEGETYRGTTTLGVRTDPQRGAPALGVAQSKSTQAGDWANMITDSPLKDGDRVTHVAGQPVTLQPDIDRIARTLDGTPIEVRLARNGGGEETITVQPQMASSGYLHYRPDGSSIKGWLVAQNRSGEAITYVGSDGTSHDVKPGELALEDNAGQVTILPAKEIVGGGQWTLGDVVGFVPRLKINGIFKDSAAAEAGLKPGDIVLAYGGRALPTVTSLRETSKEIGETETQITILRDGKSQTLPIHPRKEGQDVFIGTSQQLDIEHPVVAQVRKGSLAAQAGVEAGTEILAVNGQPVSTWVDIYHTLANHAETAAEQPVELKVRVGSIEKDLTLGVLGDVQRENLEAVRFHVLVNTNFRPYEVHIQFSNPLAAVGWGFKETARWMMSVYGQLASMARGSVGVETVGGPVALGAMAVTVARENIMKLVWFMAMLSVLLAVFNFLPLPVLDGGHAVLLLIEKVRGRPLPAKVVYVIQMVGLVLIFGLMFVIFIKDIRDLMG